MVNSAPTPGTQGGPSGLTALGFLKELARYYMDFLETDFHRRRNPKRTVRYRNADNLLVGVSLARYPSFTARVWKALAQGFSGVDHVSKGAYRTTIPQSLLRLVELEVEKITAQQIDGLSGGIAIEIGNLARANRHDFDIALNAAIEYAGAKLKSALVTQSAWPPGATLLSD